MVKWKIYFLPLIILGKYDTYLVEYPFSESEFKTISKTEMQNKKAKFTSIENDFSYRIGVMCTETWSLYITGCYCDGDYAETWELTAVNCVSTGGSDSTLMDQGLVQFQFSTLPILL
jgi:hypothetical protein